LGPRSGRAGGKLRSSSTSKQVAERGMGRQDKKGLNYIKWNVGKRLKTPIDDRVRSRTRNLD
jgi:hypothetical protein